MVTFGGDPLTIPFRVCDSLGFLADAMVIETAVVILPSPSAASALQVGEMRGQHQGKIANLHRLQTT